MKGVFYNKKLKEVQILSFRTNTIDHLPDAWKSDRL